MLCHTPTCSIVRLVFNALLAHPHEDPLGKQAVEVSGGQCYPPSIGSVQPGIMACISNSTGDGWPYSWWMDVVRCTSCCVSLVILNSGVHQLLTVLVCLFFSAVWVAVLPSARVSLKRLKFYCLDQLQIFFHNEGARTRCSCRVWCSKIHGKAY